MNENKEIEEMAREFCPIVCPNQCNHRCINVGNCQELIDACIKIRDLGYRNCKDKVVLDKEEYGRLKFIEKFGDLDIEAEVRKETAREFAKKLKKVIHERDYVEGYAYLGICEEIDELAKEYGVEVEE